MSIFKNRTTTESAFSGIIRSPQWPPDYSKPEERAKLMTGMTPDEVGFAASAAEDKVPGFYDNPRNRMNVQHAPKVRRGHDY